MLELLLRQIDAVDYGAFGFQRQVHGHAGLMVAACDADNFALTDAKAFQLNSARFLRSQACLQRVQTISEVP